MKFFKTLSVAIFVMVTFSTIQSNATHSAGMEMFYRWKPSTTSDSTYEFTVVFYRNCAGFTASAPSTMSIQARATSISGVGVISCIQLPTTGSGVPPLQPPNIFTCLDTTGTFCVEEYVYRGNWTSPKRASDWIFSYQLCCAPVTNAPTNMQNGTQYVECGLNNLDFPDHSSAWTPTKYTPVPVLVSAVKLILPVTESITKGPYRVGRGLAKLHPFMYTKLPPPFV